MKCFIVLVVVACAIGLSEAGMTKEKRMEMFQIMMNDCATREGASLADVDSLLKHKEPTTHPEKCIGACVGEQSGIIKDNKLDVEATVKITSMAFDGDAAKMDMAREIANSCGSMTDGDRCEAAAKIFDCMKKGAIAKGVSEADL